MAAYNKNNAGVKRIMAEARELSRDPSTEYTAKPTEEDLFDWHCTIRGPVDTEFEGGLYHARIVLPPEYPFKAPSIMLLTPNGRFELNKKICISFTSYHEDLWQPSWGVRTAIIGLQSFFPVKGEAAMGVGGIEVPINERKRLAGISRNWVCPHCDQSNLEMLPDPIKPQASTTESSEAAASPAEESNTANSTPSDMTSSISLALGKASTAPVDADVSPVTAPVLPSPSSSASQALVTVITEPSVTPAPQPPPAAVIVVSPPDTQPEAQVPVPVQNSRPIDLTPSTPAARVIDEVVPLTHGARDRQAIMNNNGVHPAVYQYTGAGGGTGGEARSAREIAYARGQPSARASPLVLDVLIGVLGVVFAYVVFRRFL